ncbi:MAG: hypothetical protein CVU71_11300 [Deltaproteobacteria bacterium HGW-Deltaproteobacteria-6]|jgi:hypothetical protein|nr:MAG: hypothetical protein CVU71_11300 [Deltaproteobacteria bacterium HGW-Deltaproteobacteria-6]
MEIIIMKKYGRNFIVAVVVVFSLMFVAQANALEFGARGYLWFPEQKKSDIQATADGRDTSNINTKDMLGIGNKATYSVEAFGGMGKNHVSLMYTPFGYSSDNVLATAVNYSGSTFNAGTTVRSELAYSMFDLKYQRDLINMENILAGFSLGGILQLKYSTGTFKMSSGANGFEQTRSFNSLIPMIGVGAHVGLLAKLLELRAQATAGGYGSGNYSYEALADLSLTPLPFLDIHAGYRLLQLKMDVNDYKMDTLYTGPYIGLTVGF